MSSVYKVFFKQVSELTKNELDDIVNLYLAYYDGSSSGHVVSDMKKKTEILLLKYEEKLVGFTSFELYKFCFDGEEKQIIYSGDTIVHHKHWGQQALANAWIRYIGELKSRVDAVPIYWFLIVKGHRTYKFLPAFTKSFFPHWEIDRDDLKPLLDALAKNKFGNLYDETDGLVKFEISNGHLKEKFAVIPENEKNKASVSFFLERNPNYYRGDELACLCEFDDENLRPFTKRILYAKKEDRL